MNPVVKRMLARFELAQEAESQNRQRGLDTLKFYKGGDDQWDAKMLSMRRDDNRPSETYNQLPQFVHQVTNDMRMNMPQTRFVPGKDGTKEVAEVYEDLARNIQSQSEAEVAYDFAAFYQVVIGWSYWFYYTEYEDDSTFNQIIKVGAKKNPFMIYDDPTALLPDGSDRKWLIDFVDQPLQEFNQENNKRYTSDDLKSIGDSLPDWADDDNGIIRVAHYWEVQETRSKLYRKDGKITKEQPKGVEGKDYDVREVVVPKVMWYKCTAIDKLDEKEWIGSIIPYVRVVGEELNIDGRTIYNGLVEAMKAPQKQFNYWSNTAVQMAAMAPKSPYIAAVGQIEGLEEIWDTANIRDYPVLPYNPMEVNGTMLPPPQRNQTSVDLSPMINLIQQAQQNFYNTTGIYPASLGQASNEKSGKAIIARQKEGDVSTFHFADNMARSLRAGGRILEELIRKVYDGSRTIRGVKEDKSTYEVKINQKYKDEKSGKPKEFDLTVGTYDVMVTTGPSFTTKRQEASDAMIQLASSTNLMEVAPDLVYGTQDWPGADKIAERYKKMLPPQLTEEDDNPIPPQIKQQMAQQEQALMQMQQIIQQGANEIQKLQTELAKAQNAMAQDQTKSQTEVIKLQAAIQKAEIDLAIEQTRLQKETEALQIKREELGLKQVESQNRMEIERTKLTNEMAMARINAKAANPEAGMMDNELQEPGTPAPVMAILDAIGQSNQSIAEIVTQSNQAVVAAVESGNAVIAGALMQPRMIVRDKQGNIAGVKPVGGP